MPVLAVFGVGYGFMESLVQLQIVKKLRDIGADLKIALLIVKAVTAVQVSVFVSVHSIAPFDW
jgi:hypothetical protein